MISGSGTRGTALALGLAALGLIVAGIAAWILGNDSSGDPLAGILIRSGAVLGAAALVAATFRKPSTTTLVVAGAGVVLVLLRPALIWVALVLWVGWLIVGRQRNTPSKES